MPIAIMIFISFRHFKHLIIPQWIPLLNSESVTTRYMIIPLLVILLIAVINLQHFIDKGLNRIRIKITIFSLITLIFYSLINHSRHWRMHVIDNEHLWYIELVSITVGLKTTPLLENNYNDTIYIYTFWAGVLITLISVVLIITWFSFNKKLNSFIKK